MERRSIQVLVPDIGDFDEVEIIEVLVAKGDRVEVEDSLVTLESDKATMEIPSPEAGIVGDLSVQLGDRVSEGTLLLVLDVDEAAAEEAPPDDPEERAERAEGQGDDAPQRPSPTLRPGDPPPSPPPVPDERRGGDVLPHASPLVRK